MNITYDKSITKLIWNIFSSYIKDKTCPFCGQIVTMQTCAGFFIYKKPGLFHRRHVRIFHKSLPCLLDYDNYIHLKELK